MLHCFRLTFSGCMLKVIKNLTLTRYTLTISGLIHLFRYGSGGWVILTACCLPP